MPKNKFQEVVFTAIMATIMVYGMVVYADGQMACILRSPCQRKVS